MLVDRLCAPGTKGAIDWNEKRKLVKAQDQNVQFTEFRSICSETVSEVKSLLLDSKKHSAFTWVGWESVQLLLSLSGAILRFIRLCYLPLTQVMMKKMCRSNRCSNSYIWDNYCKIGLVGVPRVKMCSMKVSSTSKQPQIKTYSTSRCGSP